MIFVNPDIDIAQC